MKRYIFKIPDGTYADSLVLSAVRRKPNPFKLMLDPLTERATILMHQVQRLDSKRCMVGKFHRDIIERWAFEPKSFFAPKNPN